ncbi:hypothetical protein MAMC_01914 [Methylacidimicrobium cyclopophantes]|uniref:Knr4/Smi1-like domain-containing protein n=1 Tax=Methylacidimicrobium cyclopophantes TaxID=1041766 RepID=A0A5E6MFF0_9BACT|nr:YrhA family protein [Methylacidimicrobium cyclopophantes]VVM07960.1 hypothetical protein MAMC_01914 [Methylacidimicrobium cyclopophantes]
MNYKTYVALVNEEEQAAGFQPFAGRPPARVAAYAREVQERFGIAIPPDYLDFLSLADGLAHNGVVFYAIDQDEEEDQFLPGLLAENLVLQDLRTQPDYLFLGHSDIFRYAYSFPEKKYFALYADSLAPAAKFSDFNELMVNVLKHEALGLFDDEEETGDEEDEELSDEELEGEPGEIPEQGGEERSAEGRSKPKKKGSPPDKP